jgi:hypothetical protein
MNKRPDFTTEQIDWIIYQISEWHFEWKPHLISWKDQPHRLSYAKELLKAKICGQLADDFVE